MQLWLPILVIVCSYVIGSLPTGVIIVRLSTGQDVRGVGSGRMGGTNAMRAAGFWAGLGTAIVDILKSTVTVWLALFLFPDNPWLHILAPLAAVIGHNYSIFLVRMNNQGRLDLSGGAGGAPTVGGALGLWPASILFIIPMGAMIFYFIGYASVTTMSVALITTLIFAYRAWVGLSPWQYVLYGVVAEILLLWSLRPNIQRLLDGTERVVGYRARKEETVSDKSDRS